MLEEVYMSEEMKSNGNSSLDELEFCSIDELLDTIDELENREPFKPEYSKHRESSLIDSDNFSEDLIIKSDQKECPSNSIDSTRKKPRRAGIKKREEQESVASVIFGWVKVIVFAVIIALLINKFIIANALIPSGSMESTIMTGDRVIGLRTSYLFTSPDRGDIVIFKNPDDESKLYIKRVIGLPGDKVEIIDGLVYINDSEEPLGESYLTVTPKGNFGPYEVPDESYFMLGDNRNVSKDSRYWENTFVKEDKIIAKAYLRYYPSWGIIK